MPVRAMRIGFLVALFGLFGVLVAVPSGSAAAQAGAQTETIVDFDYSPRTTTVDVGTTLRWTNTGARPHTATDRGGTFDTGVLIPNRSHAVTFTVPGTYFYFCRVNPARMNGTIVVRPSAQPSRVVRVQAVDPGFTGDKFRFNPDKLTVAAGTTLQVANVGGKPHTLTADDGTFDTGVIDPGAEGGRFAGHSTTITLDKPGTYAFHCEVHPKAMKGVVTVTGTAGQGPAPRSSAPTSIKVTARDFNFNPVETSVAPGGTVVVTNSGQAPHTMTFDDVKLDTGTLQPGQQGKLTAPTKPGSYSFRCTIHPAQMRGVVVVVGSGVADPTKQGSPRAAPAAAVSGPGGGVSSLALVTGVAGAFFGGFGLSAFLVRRRPAT